jgi:hypothetical protein
VDQNRVNFLPFYHSICDQNQSESMKFFSYRTGLFTLLVSMLMFSGVLSFACRPSALVKFRSSHGMQMSIQDIVTTHLPRIMSTLQLADTSISEEEVLNTVGQAGDLPDPFFTVLVAGVIVLGVAVLQFSLGDLTKEVSCTYMI